MPRRVALAIAACVLAACAQESAYVEAVREAGLVPDPPGTSGRDVGFSARFGGRSVWVFGDTFFAEAAADGYRWRSSSWSYTDDDNAADGLGGWTHALGADGKPLQLLPHTAAEQAFNDAHNGSPCPAGDDCGGRHTPWPAAFVVDPASGTALVFYSLMETHTTSSFAFESVGTSIATWASPEVAAVRPPVVLFAADEPPWGAAALIDGDFLYAYACAGGSLASPCQIARVAVADAFDRAAWRFWDGGEWVADWRAAADLFDGAPLMSVHYSPYLEKYVAFYLVPLGSELALRTADRPEGPWSAADCFGLAEPARDGNWDYALFAHPELAQDGGRVEVLSYYQPGTFLNGTVHLLELTYR